jgi:hypothetical protein
MKIGFVLKNGSHKHMKICKVELLCIFIHSFFCLYSYHPYILRFYFSVCSLFAVWEATSILETPDMAAQMAKRMNEYVPVRPCSVMWPYYGVELCLIQIRSGLQNQATGA